MINLHIRNKYNIVGFELEIFIWEIRYLASDAMELKCVHRDLMAKKIIIIEFQMTISLDSGRMVMNYYNSYLYSRNSTSFNIHRKIKETH